MGNVAVVTDSTAYLTQDIIQTYGIHVVPLSVNFGDQTFKEDTEITTNEFYKKLEGSNKLPTTSQPSIGDFVTLYENLAKDGYEEVIAIHLSSGISGTMSTSQVAGGMVEGIEVEVIDSEIACYGLGFMVIEAAKMAEQGKGLDEIKARIDWIVQNMRGYFVVDDLAHLHRGGRLNAAQFLVGSMLKIKPIIHFQDTKLEPFEKIRTKRKAIERIYKLLDEDVKAASKIKLSVVQANILEEAEGIAAEIMNKYENVEVNISEFGPVIGTHVGPGTIGFVWYIAE